MFREHHLVLGYAVVGPISVDVLDGRPARHNHLLRFAMRHPFGRRLLEEARRKGKPIGLLDVKNRVLPGHGPRLLLRPEQDPRAFLAFADVTAGGFNLSISAPAIVAAKPLLDAPAHQVDTVAAAVLLAAREVLRRDPLARRPGLLPGRDPLLDLLDEIIADPAGVVAAELPLKREEWGPAPPRTRRVDVGKSAHILVHGHSDLLREPRRRFNPPPAPQGFVPVILAVHRQVFLAVFVFLFLESLFVSSTSEPEYHQRQKTAR